MRALNCIIGALAVSVVVFTGDRLTAEPVNEIVVGGYYYVKGFFEDSKVQVISVDRVGKRVKVYDEASQNVDWVSAEAVITRSDSVDRDLDRVQVGVKILGAIWESMNAPSGQTAAQEEPWHPGRKHPSLSNVVAGANRNEWQPEPGYAWAADSTGGVVWTPGLAHPTEKGFVSSFEKDKWATDLQFVIEKMQQEGKRADEARTAPYGDAPNVSGVLFKPSEVDIYCNKTQLDSLHFFHGKVVDYAGVSHVIFDQDDHWVVVVLKDGTSLNLGMRVGWVVRPCFAFATGVTFGRTRDGATLEMRRFPLLRIDSEHKVVERDLLGVHLTKKTDGSRGQGDIIYSVMDGSSAAEAGLKRGDEIVSIDGQSVDGVEGLRRIVDNRSGESVVVEYAREGRRQTVSLRPQRGVSVEKISH